MMYFYYVKAFLSETISPRWSCEWPPIGGEGNRIVWKIELTGDDLKLSFGELQAKYLKTALSHLTQEL